MPITAIEIYPNTGFDVTPIINIRIIKMPRITKHIFLAFVNSIKVPRTITAFAYFLLSTECKMNAPIVAIEKIMPKYPSRLRIAPTIMPMYPNRIVARMATIIFPIEPYSSLKKFTITS